MAVYDKEKEKTSHPNSDESHDDVSAQSEQGSTDGNDVAKLHDSESADSASSTSASESSEKAALGSTTGSSDTNGNWDTNVGEGKQSRGIIRGRFTRRQGFIFGGGAITTLGLLIAISGFLSGPLQFVQFAQLLEQFHFSQNQDFMDGRVGKLIKYARTTNAPEKRNLGAAGNKIANHYQKKLASAGMEPRYENGRISSIDIDPDTHEGKQALAAMKEQGATIDFDDAGKANVKLDGNARSRRLAVDGMVDAIGMNKVSSSLSARVLKVRGAVDFHPLKNIARAADEDLKVYVKKVKDERNKSINEGVKPDADLPDAKEDPKKPSNDADKTAAAEIKSGTRELNDIATSPNVTTAEKVSTIKGKIGAGIGATAIVGTVCGLQQLGVSVAETQESNIIQPLLRTGMSVVTTGSQIMTGQDVNMETVGALSENLYNKEDETSWASARSIQSELGQEETGPDIPESAKPGRDKPAFFKTIDGLVSVFPGGEGLCSAINSTIGGIALTVGGIAASATGPGSAALAGLGEIAQNQILGAFMDDIVRILAGAAVDISNAAGASFGSYANYGAFLANNSSFMAVGGPSLTTDERASLADENQSIARIKEQNKSWYARTLDPYDANSLISKSVIQNPNMASTQKGFASFTQLPATMFSSLGSSITGLIPNAKAQSVPFDYGVDQFGFTADEINSDTYDDPYANADRVESTPGKIADLNGKYGKCFGSTIDPTTGRIKVGQAPTYTQYETMKAKCSNRANAELTDYRFYLADKMAAGTVLCYESLDDEACQDIGLSSTGADPASQTDSTNPTSTAGAAVVGNPYETSASIACAPGTDDLGIHTGYTSGSPVEHRMCGVTNLPSGSSESQAGSAYYLEGANGHAIVNSRLSGALFAMVNDAQAAGVTLKATSSYRVMAHQEALWNQFGRDTARVARPGSSPHQAGTAIDFSNMGSQGHGSNGDCSNRARLDGNPGWDWLFVNAERYGFKQYSYETWHWDPGPPGVSNRCDSSQP